MKSFNAITLDLDRAYVEVLQLRDRLAAKRSLRERQDILPFFRQRPHLSTLCGKYDFPFGHADRVAWEYDLFGDFLCDMVVGNSATGSYTFVEFEDAGPGSLFVSHGKKATREWSPRFLHGFGQLVDWFRKLDDMQKSDTFEARFQKRSINWAGVLVAGRDHDLSADERLRLEWWRNHIVAHSRRIHCVTYDELVANLLNTLEASRRPFGKRRPGRATQP